MRFRPRVMVHAGTPRPDGRGAAGVDRGRAPIGTRLAPLEWRQCGRWWSPSWELWCEGDRLATFQTVGFFRHRAVVETGTARWEAPARLEVGPGDRARGRERAGGALPRGLAALGVHPAGERWGAALEAGMVHALRGGRGRGGLRAGERAADPRVHALRGRGPAHRGGTPPPRRRAARDAGVVAAARRAAPPRALSPCA